MFSIFTVLNAVTVVIDVVKVLLIMFLETLPSQHFSLNRATFINVWILKWGKGSVYLLAFDSPRSISCSPHVSLELFECCWLPVCCHLPQHIIHYFPNGLLLICVNRLVHGVDRARTMLFHVFFNLPQQSGFLLKAALQHVKKQHQWSGGGQTVFFYN